MSTNRKRLQQLVDRLRSKGADVVPARAAQLDEVLDALVVPAPAAIRDLYLLAEGLDVGRVEVFTLHELADVNTQPALREYFAEPFYFASDGGDGFFFVDTRGELGDRGAVVWIDRGAPTPNFAVPCARDLVSFLEEVEAGEEPWEGPTFEERWVDATRAFLDRTDAYEARPPASIETILAASDRAGVHFPPALDALLERTDGLVLRGAGVELHRAAEIAAIDEMRDEDGLAEALWIGERPGGARLAITVGGWRGLSSGTVLEVPAGRPASEGTVLGPLPVALERWAKDGGS